MIRICICLMLFSLCLSSCKTNSDQWEGQAMIERVNTETVPIERQERGVFELGEGIFASNDFDGARMNEVNLSGDSLITVHITSENTPINESPWYAFKIWADTARKLQLKLTYQDSVQHRYPPKLSLDGKQWMQPAGKSAVRLNDATSDSEFTAPRTHSMFIGIGPDTLWVAAQEVVTPNDVSVWMDGLAIATDIRRTNVGQSLEGRDIDMLTIGNPDAQQKIMIITRQHPPEVTGYLAMQAFVETICDNTTQAAKFRDLYEIHVIPMLNPDGVVHGHWRHSAAGIDLNRDWEAFHQPETRLVRDLMQTTADKGGEWTVAIDFHSTYEDIYYIMDPSVPGNHEGLITALIEAVGEQLPEDYTVNISPRPVEEPPVTSLAYFFHTFGAESLIYEVGDNTARNLVRHKGELTALQLMELLAEE